MSWTKSASWPNYTKSIHTIHMGRNKYSAHEIDIIGKLLKRKCAGTRFQQKEIRHKLRVDFEFNISDFNVQGQAFGYDELQECIKRGRIQILDDATIEDMKAKRQRDRERDAQLALEEQVEQNEVVDWEKVQKEWDEYYNAHPEERPEGMEDKPKRIKGRRR